MFWWRDEVHGLSGPSGRSGGSGLVIDVGFTDRVGGQSSGPLDSLNLGLGVGDDPEVVGRNRASVAASIGVAPQNLVFSQQVHGAQVRTVRSAVSADPGEVPRCDAQVTDVPGLALGVLVADCTPVIVVDAEAGIVATAHAGRPGMTLGVVDAMLDRVVEMGSNRQQAFVGPSVCPRCYEVPWQMREDAAQRNPVARSVSWTGTPAIDVAAAVVAQLRHRDVEVTWIAGCTRESERLFSHRRDPAAGRCAGVVAIRASDHGDV